MIIRHKLWNHTTDNMHGTIHLLQAPKDKLKKKKNMQEKRT